MCAACLHACPRTLPTCRSTFARFSGSAAHTVRLHEPMPSYFKLQTGAPAPGYTDVLYLLPYGVYRSGTNLIDKNNWSGGLVNRKN